MSAKDCDNSALITCIGREEVSLRIQMELLRVCSDEMGDEPVVVSTARNQRMKNKLVIGVETVKCAVTVSRVVSGTRYELAIVRARSDQTRFLSRSGRKPGREAVARRQRTPDSCHHPSSTALVKAREGAAGNRVVLLWEPQRHTHGKHRSVRERGKECGHRPAF